MTAACRAAVAAAILATPLPIGCRRLPMESARAEVASRIRPDYGLSRALSTIPNPKGDGVVVYVHDPDGCGPSHTWIWAGPGSIYALDSASAASTPGVERLASAPFDLLPRLGTGLNTDALSAVIRAEVCKRPFNLP